METPQQEAVPLLESSANAGEVLVTSTGQQEAPGGTFGGWVSQERLGENEERS